MHQEAFGDGICLDQLEVYGSPVRLVRVVAREGQGWKKMKERRRRERIWKGKRE